MNFSATVLSEGGQTRLAGRLDLRDDRDNLIRMLAGLAAPADEIELCFYDALTLPAAIVDAMAGIRRRGPRLHIQVCHRYLAHYLNRLGFVSRYIQETPPPEPLGPIAAIAIGGGAGGEAAMVALLERLPPAPVAVFVVQHTTDAAHSGIDLLLKARTEHYRVELPFQLSTVVPGVIYVAPPDRHMKVANGLIYVTRDSRVHGARPAIDPLFESVAREYGPGAMAVLLSCGGEDGVHGARVLAARGACVLAEEACPPRFGAPSSGRAPQLLNGPGITSFLGSALTREERTPNAALVQEFLGAVLARYGYDYRGYQPDTLQRRILNAMTLLGCEDFFEFQRRVLIDPEAFQCLFLQMSVEVTSFFRHPEQFRILREEVLPYLDSFPNLRIWSAGCATGEEAFSLAILLEELGMLAKTRIFATDLNPHALDQAQSGLFPLEPLDENRANYLASGGSRAFDDYVENNGLYLTMPERLRERILFHQHSLVQDGVFNEFELILCRNVLIYFRSEIQTQVLARFGEALHPDGFLVLGAREGLMDAEGSRRFTQFRGSASRIYRWNR